MNNYVFLQRSNISWSLRSPCLVFSMLSSSKCIRSNGDIICLLLKMSASIERAFFKLSLSAILFSCYSLLPVSESYSESGPLLFLFTNLNFPLITFIFYFKFLCIPYDFKKMSNCVLSGYRMFSCLYLVAGFSFAIISLTFLSHPFKLLKVRFTYLWKSSFSNPSFFLSNFEY
jgi:hypothetical protein